MNTPSPPGRLDGTGGIIFMYTDVVARPARRSSESFAAKSTHKRLFPGAKGGSIIVTN